MTEYKRLREFVEGEDAKADDVETEFDNVASVLKKGITSANLAPGYLPKAGAWASGRVHVPGGGVFTIIPEQTFELTGSSLVHLDFNASMEFNPAGESEIGVAGELYVDGALRCYGYYGIAAPLGTGKYMGTASGSTVIALAAGAHSIRLQGSVPYVGGASLTEVMVSSMTYLSIPAA